jgi:hypothetical protein
MCGAEENWSSYFLVDGEVWWVERIFGKLELLEKAVLVGDI